MKNLFLLFICMLMVSACAKSPESIAPAYVSPLTYDGLKCSQIAKELGRVDNALSHAYTQQRNARSNDTMGVILLGLPVSSLSGGNIADQIAKMKGEKETLEKLATEKSCGIEFKSIVAAPAPEAAQPEQVKSKGNWNQ